MRACNSETATSLNNRPASINRLMGLASSGESDNTTKKILNDFKLIYFTLTSFQNGGNEDVTEGTVTQGQATPVDASSTPNSSTITSTSTVPSTTKTSGLLGCHDLRASGETEARIYSLASGKELNEGARDYNTRFCDQTTDGGGWTVRLVTFPPRSSSPLLRVRSN